jgi:hypothetical protein
MKAISKALRELYKTPAAREVFRKAGARGGKATASRRTAAQRSEAARKAVQARWAKAKGKSP